MAEEIKNVEDLMKEIEVWEYVIVKDGKGTDQYNQEEGKWWL